MNSNNFLFGQFEVAFVSKPKIFEIAVSDKQRPVTAANMKPIAGIYSNQCTLEKPDR